MRDGSGAARLVAMARQFDALTVAGSSTTSVSRCCRPAAGLVRWS
ncbi:hypothetical protein [Micromonospora sp. NPDC002575]